MPLLIRNDTTSLFAALDIAGGAATEKCYKQHRATDFPDFLDQIDQQMPEGVEAHMRLAGDAVFAF